MKVENFYKEIKYGELLLELIKWSKKYFIILHFDENPETCQNHIYINKDDVTLFDYGGNISAEICITNALNYIYKINRTDKKERIV